MIYSRNAGEFRDAFERVRREFRERYDRHLRRAAAQYAGEEAEAARRVLEHGVRVYLLDGFLHALNWNLFGTEFASPSLVPEASVQSAQSRSIRRMDYLGIERDTEQPLLDLEAKRPSPLPRDVEWNGASPGSYVKREVVRKVSQALASIRDERPQDTDIGSDWLDSLLALRDYARSVHARVGQAPRRSAVTDGTWVLVFADPYQSLVEDNPDPGLLHVFFLDYLESDFHELFELLEYQHVLGSVDAMSPAQLPFHVTVAQVAYVLHGLRILYTRKRSIFHAAPQIVVQPLLFVRTTLGGWLTIEHREEFTLPTDGSHLRQHLDAVRNSAETLLAEVSQRLNGAVSVGSLEDHYADATNFAALPGVRRTRSGEEQHFVIVTGREHHYLHLRPTILNCPYHAWSPDTGTDHMIPASSVNPPSYYAAGADHHCAHRDVSGIKASQVTEHNRGSVGPRSPAAGGAFCEIWTFEQFLCCRTCVFLSVCEKAAVFRLPCRSAPGTGQP